MFTKKLFSRLVETSQVLEDFLDFHGAKNNQNWFFYRELTSAVRHLSLSGYSQKHISNRLIYYNLPDSDAFDSQGDETLQFLTDCLMKLSPVILKEADRLAIPTPQNNFEVRHFPGIVTGEMLDYDMNDEGGEEQKKNIVKIASNFLVIADIFDKMGVYEPKNLDEIMAMVPEHINEVEIRRYEVQVHNLQSYFDTYVIHGGFSHGNEKLKRFRSFFSVVFHLLQLVGRLLHFYERHLHDPGYKIRYKAVRKELAILVNPQRLLDLIVNYGLYWVCHYLSKGRGLARELLNENIERASIEVGIPKDRGFHCRPSLLVAKIVQHYGGQVEMLVNGDRFDASSVLDMQWAGGKIQNEGVARVMFEGDYRALKDIEILSKENYGEDTMGKGKSLPLELNYLRED